MDVSLKFLRLTEVKNNQYDCDPVDVFSKFWVIRFFSGTHNTRVKREGFSIYLQDWGRGFLSLVLA